MMVDYGVNIKPHLVGVLNLPENLPGHFRVGFSRSCLHLGVDTESHHYAPQLEISRLSSIATPFGVRLRERRKKFEWGRTVRLPQMNRRPQPIGTYQLYRNAN